MADQRGKNGKPNKPGVLPDMEWLRRSRHDIPAIARDAMPENPLLQLKQQSATRPSERAKPPAADSSNGAKSENR